MDDKEFESHAEKEFWEKFLLSRLGWALPVAIAAADEAVEARRLRMRKLQLPPGVKAA